MDFANKTAWVTLRKGSLTRDAVVAAFEGSRYGVSSFEKIESRPKEYIVTVSGMT